MNAPESIAARLQMLPPHLLDPSPTNPRKTFPQASLEELADSIRQVGVLSPLLVRPSFTSGRYEIVAGERRWRAATIAQVDAVPVIVRELDDVTVVRMQCIENLQREDVSPHEEAAGFRLLVQRFDYSPERIATEIGKSRSYVFARLKLTELSKDVLDWLESEEVREADLELSTSHLLLVARIPVPKLQLKAAREMLGMERPYWKPMSFRDAQEHVHDKYMLRLREAPWWKADPLDLVEEAGSCGACPKRSGNACDLFQDVTDANVCTDPECFADKRKAWARRVRQEAQDKGIDVLPSKEAQRVLGASSWQPDPDWIKLDERCQQDPKGRSFRQLLEGADIKVSAAQESDSGKLIELAPRAAVVKALKAQDIKLPAIKKDTAPARPANQRDIDPQKQERQALALKAVFDAVRMRYQRDPAFVRADFQLIAEEATCWLNDGEELWALWGWKDGRPAWGDEFQTWRTARLAELSAEDLVRLLIDVALIAEVCEGDDNPKRLRAIAERLGIDVESVMATALAEHDAQQGVVQTALAKKRKAKAAE